MIVNFKLENNTNVLRLLIQKFNDIFFDMYLI